MIYLLITEPLATGVFWRDSVVHAVPVKQKVVALTYDDGPHPVFTPQILDELDRYGVKATFFMIGSRMEQYPDIVKEVVARGHSIGNHTYTHPENIEENTSAQVIRELDQSEQVIERLTGKDTELFRPPRGLIDGEVFSIVEKEGFRTILWSVSADHHDAPTPSSMAARVRRFVRPGAIILLHDGRINSREKDVTATPIIIRSLKNLGYRFVTVPELLKLGSHVRVRRAKVKKPVHVTTPTPSIVEPSGVSELGGRRFA